MSAGVIVGATVCDAAGGRHDDHGVWWDDDGVIRAVGPSDDVLRQARDEARDRDGEPAGAALDPVEVHGVVAPGMINMHVHLGLALPGPMSERVNRSSDAEYVLMMADAARRTVHSGITSVRLVGESRFLDIALRAAIDRGSAVGPRIWTACHALCCTGGHGWDADACEADGAVGFREATRRQIRAGADLIKICISGGIAGEHEQIHTPQLMVDEMGAAIDIAHAWGRQVTAHAGPADVIAEALALGLDGVEHGYQLDDAVVATMVRQGTWYVPTITVSRCKAFFEEVGVPVWMMDRALAAGPRHWESLQKAIAAGVRIAMGSDMPPYAPYDETTATVREMEFMQEAGMAPADVLAAATTSAATWLGTDRVGRIAAGCWADFVVLDHDPLADIGAYRGVRAVVKGGETQRDDHGELRGLVAR